MNQTAIRECNRQLTKLAKRMWPIPVETGASPPAVLAWFRRNTRDVEAFQILTAKLTRAIYGPPKRKSR
jgi:hypothetical protein